MYSKKQKFIAKAILKLIQFYCWFRQPKQKERMLATLFLLPGIILLAPSFNFELTLVHSFLFQAMITYGVLSAFWIYKAHYRVSMVNFAVFFLLLARVSSPIQKGDSFEFGDEQLSVLQFNVLVSNNQYHSTIESVKELNPDFISFQEVTQAWGDALEEGLQDEYPYFKIVSHDLETQGLAIFSKFPLENVTYHDWSGTANLSGIIKVGDEDVNFLSLHTRSPMTKDRWKNRNEHIKKAANHVAEKEGEFIVLGDFNTVPWDSQMIKFRKDTELVDSRKKLTPTYPAWGPKYLAQIPIDYIFHSKGIRCGSLDSIKMTSDHNAVLGEFEIL